MRSKIKNHFSSFPIRRLCLFQFLFPATLDPPSLFRSLTQDCSS
ncbi:unnamed protein product [Arabidopsis halleri]